VETRTATHEELGLGDEEVVAMFRVMLTARICDEVQLALNRQGRAAFVVPSAGHEGCQVGTAWPLRKRHDVWLPYYRDLAVTLIAGFSVTDVFLGVFGKSRDPSSSGRQMPAHWSSHDLGIVSLSSPIGTQIPHAAGIAYAIRYLREDKVVACWFGEGTTSEGDWHEGMNFSGIHKLPVVWVCENNLYAISVPISKQMGVQSVAIRADSYGFPGVTVDGNDPLACYAAMKEAVDRARSGGGPTLIEALTYRFQPHTSDDDDTTYRSREEVEHAKEHDPLKVFGDYLRGRSLLAEEGEAGMREEIRAEVQLAVDEAWAAEDPDPATLLDNLFGSAGP
jgi:2-oxoisovalerate dehydrogenase E1 component alpha subunit